MSEEDNSTEEEVEESEKKAKEPTPRFDPEALGQGIAERMETMMLFMWMTCMATGFWITHPMLSGACRSPR